VIALRVSRRNAFVAAAGWVAAADWRCGAEGETDPPVVARRGAARAHRVFPIYRDLARFLGDPDPDRSAALSRALDSRHAAALTAYGPGFEEYLLDQLAELGPADAAWAAAADTAGVVQQVRTGLERARTLLGTGESPAAFLIFSRRFDGRADGRNIFFGVNRFGAERLRDQVALLTAHEYNHIVRARVGPFTTLLDAVVAEGLATACSALAEPGRPVRDYLLFSRAQHAWFTPERLALLWQDFRRDARSTDPGARARYLEGGSRGPHGAPPRSGYLLGDLIVGAWLARGASIARLTRMPTAELWTGSGYAR
jgi:hypothetical protein